MPNVVVDPHYILSLKHEGKIMRLWAPEAMGYVDTLEAAGRFAGDEVRANLKRYANHVEAVAERASAGHVVRRSRLKGLTCGAIRVANFRARASTKSEPASGGGA